jgi:hypothetical protein
MDAEGKKIRVKRHIWGIRYEISNIFTTFERSEGSILDKMERLNGEEKLIPVS